jgi:PAS domain S-box-containing protein
MKSETECSQLTQAAELRRTAEERWKENAPDSECALLDHVAEQRLLHELQVHQIELEMQNEELHQARDKTDALLCKYTELYDFAPVGYISLDHEGIILSANFTVARILGVERSRLFGRRFELFICDGIRPIFNEFLGKVFKSLVKESCEVALSLEGKSAPVVRIEAIAFELGQECRVAVTDITDRKQAEAKLQLLYDELELKVLERTEDLSRTNLQLTHEVEERKNAEASLQASYLEINQLKNRLQAENVYLQQEVDQKHNFGEIIGNSTILSSVFNRIQQVAPMNATVLLLGETGTGKGVVARAIHSRSARKGRAMVTVNCTALPANLIESELFGRERGAFTGASDRQIGRFELADGGTIFLDEIGEMPMDLQCKLLRVIQDGEFERLGSPRTIKVDVRIIAATNRFLEEEIRNGKFREDLFYRLNVFPISIPPLRQRIEDIPLLVNFFITKFNRKNNKKITSVTKDTLNALQEYHWPGNVRELESIIERAVIISQGTTLQVLDRFDTFRKADEPPKHSLKALVELEHEHILLALQKTFWRIEGEKGAAVLLGLNPSTLRARMRKYGIVRN